MSAIEISKEDVEFMQKCYLNELNFDLTDSNNKGHTFYENFQLLLTLDSNSEQFKYIFLNNLLGTIEYLNAIKKIDIKEYERFKIRLTKNIKNVGFYGDMFELYIAWTLIEKKTKFNKIEPPDFEVIFDNNKLFIECASAQFDFNKTPSKEEIFSKIKKTLRNKMKKPYANLSTALFIDITNLCYHSQVLNIPLTHIELRRALIDVTQELLDSTSNLISINHYGFIMFFSFKASKTVTGEVNYDCNTFGNNRNINADSNLIKYIESNLLSHLGIQDVETPKFHH